MIAFLALLAVLSLRFVDDAAHRHAHADGAPASAVVLVDLDQGCAKDDFHGAAHCASQMAEALQRSVAFSPSHGESTVSPVPVTWEMPRDGRSPSPPVRPPLA